MPAVLAYDPWDLEVGARTLLGEARGEPPRAQAAVVWAMVNRALDPAGRWSRRLAAVCLQPLQFSCWNRSDPNRRVIVEAPYNGAELRVARRVVQDVLDGRVEDPVAGANHYLTHAAATRVPPDWYDPAKIVAREGAHRFLKL